MKVNIVIIKPGQYRYALSFLDPALQLVKALQLSGIDSTVLVNRLKKDSVNIVLGAHSLDSFEVLSEYKYIILNLEQLQHGHLPEAYIKILNHCALIDNSEENLKVLGRADTGGLLKLGYLEGVADSTKRESQKFADFCFYGALSELRIEVLEAVDKSDFNLMLFDNPIFGPERDHLLGNCRFVINIPYYEGGPLEDVRIAHCLSLGVPVVSIASSESHLSEFVLHFASVQELLSPEGRLKLIEWEKEWPNIFGRFRLSPPAIFRFGEAVSVASINYEDTAFEKNSGGLVGEQPSRANIGCSSNYILGWLNVDVAGSAFPDIVFDFARTMISDRISIRGFFDDREFYLGPETFDFIYSDGRDACIENPRIWYSNILFTLKVGGIAHLIFPADVMVPSLPSDKKFPISAEIFRLRIAEEINAFGSFFFRFDLVSLEYLDSTLSKSSGGADALFLSVKLRKVATSPSDRNTFRLSLPDFGLSEIVSRVVSE